LPVPAVGGIDGVAALGGLLRKACQIERLVHALLRSIEIAQTAEGVRKRAVSFQRIGFSRGVGQHGIGFCAILTDDLPGFRLMDPEVNSICADGERRLAEQQIALRFDLNRFICCSCDDCASLIKAVPIWLPSVFPYPTHLIL